MKECGLNPERCLLRATAFRTHILFKPFIGLYWWWSDLGGFWEWSRLVFLLIFFCFSPWLGLQARRTGWLQWEINFRFQKFSSGFGFRREKKHVFHPIWKDEAIFIDLHSPFASPLEIFSSPFLIFFLISNDWSRGKIWGFLNVLTKFTEKRKVRNILSLHLVTSSSRILNL